MQRMKQAQGHTGSYQGSKANFLGRRSKLAHTAPSSRREEAEPSSAQAGPTDASAGRPYFPSNGRHRHLNFLGRTSWERKDRLLVN